MAVRQLHREALEDAGSVFREGSWDDDLKQIQAVYVDTGGEFLVGTIDGQIVAMGALLLHSFEEAEIKRMRVHPNHQRRGLGSQVLQSLEDRARASGISRLRLDTTSVQHAAQKFYETKGYREVDRKVRKTWEFMSEFIYYEKVL